MILLKFHGEYGNNIYQYCFARSIAQAAKTKLMAYGKTLTPFARNITFGNNALFTVKVKVLLGHNHDFGELIEEAKKHHLLLIGYFQRFGYFEKYKDTIKYDWLPARSVDYGFEPDLTIHIRGGNRIGGRESKIHPLYPMLPVSFYRKIIEENNYKKVAVVTSDLEDPIAKTLEKQYEARLFSGTVENDFNFIRNSRRIVLSVSSFSWWSAWLSNAEKIYYPEVGLFDQKECAKLPEKRRPNLVVVDDERYVYIPLKAPTPWLGNQQQIKSLLD